MVGEEFREGASVEEFKRLKGAVVEDVQADGDGYRLTFKLTDGRTLASHA